MLDNKDEEDMTATLEPRSPAEATDRHMLAYSGGREEGFAA